MKSNDVPVFGDLRWIYALMLCADRRMPKAEPWITKASKKGSHKFLIRQTGGYLAEFYLAMNPTTRETLVWDFGHHELEDPTGFLWERGIDIKRIQEDFLIKWKELTKGEQTL